jgi:hypothetical protein
LKTGFDNVETRTTTSDRTTYFLAEPPSSLKFSSCGLSIYGATGCPWYASTIFKTLRESKDYRNATTSDIPYASVSTILRQNSSISFLNETIGFPKWIAVGVYLGVIDFIFSKGSAMITTEELYDIYLDMRTEVATMSFGSNPTTNQLLGTKLMLHAISQHIQDNWIEEYKNATTFLVYSEWKSTSNEVRCSILGHTCVWQWGAVSHLSDFTMTNTAMLSIIDRAKKLNTNPASLYYDGNSASIYDSYMYCQKVLIPNIEPNDCMDIDDAEQGATVTFPAGLASGAENIDQSNATLIKLNYAKKSTTEKNQFIYLGCNISYLMHEVYRNKTTFHDEFVIRYLNKYKYPTYSHNFTVGNWEELGYSQWGGGYVTYALESVFSIYNLKRAGMWYIGDAEYYRKIPEYYSWAITNGHPYLNISNITHVTMLLNSLTRDDEVGVELRHHIMYRATTLIGDNTFQYTDMWYTNEYAYVSEFKQGNFSCYENKELNPICQILQTSDESSASQCLFIETEIYEVCSLRVIGTKTRSASNWVTNCNIFQPTGDFTCNTVKLFDDNHPVLSKRGLIVEKMMVSFVIDIIMKDNLWCANSITCQFKQSGLFTTISVNQLLFDGYTDASYLKYLDIKYSSKNFTIECLENSYDSCGKKNYYCSYESGIKIKLTNEELVLNSNSLPFQKFYVERFYHFNYSYFLWPEDNNITLALEAQSLIKEQPNSIYSMLNPYYALYPAWDNTSSANEPFLKHYQCQGRYLYGPPSLYNSCITTVNTGKRDLSQVSNVEKFNGNATLFQYSSDSVGILVNGTINEQLPPGLWDSFRLYPYSYRGNRKGADYYTSVSNPTFFNPIHALRLEMTQTEIESWDKVQRIFPTFQTVFNENKSLTYFILSRRFQEDYSSWRPYESNYSRDSYGMEYDVPVAMSSVERLAGYPIFIGTPHNYGNVLWGGTEYLQINGLNPVSQEHRSYIDFDPVTGKVLRRASRQQVLPLLLSLLTSHHITISSISALKDLHSSKFCTLAVFRQPNHSPQAMVVMPMFLSSGLKTAESLIRWSLIDCVTTSTLDQVSFVTLPPSLPLFPPH